MSGILCIEAAPLAIICGVVGLLVLIGLYLGLMFLYGSLRKKFAKRDINLGAELSTLGIVLAVGIIINFCILLWYSEETLQSPGAAFRAIYQSIGSFVFEGLAIDFKPGQELCVGASCLLAFFFYGWPLLIGAVFASLFTAKANYEWFSIISIRVQRLKKTKTNIYIFTALNEETLQIAESLNTNNPIIIFCGPKLPAFDSKNELCRRVVKNSFYYCRYRDNQSTNTPLIETLGLKAFQRSEEDSTISETQRIIIFSFDSKQGIPIEEQNFSFVFDDADKVFSFIDNKNRLEDKIPSTNHPLEKGVFWVVDSEHPEKNKDYFCSVECNEDGMAPGDTNERESDSIFDFKKSWKKLDKTLTEGKNRDELLYGIVNIQNSIARVFLPVTLNNEFFQSYIVDRYGLTKPSIKKVIFIPNGTISVEYYILSKREKNYQAYQGRLDELKNKYAYSLSGTICPVSITVWSEANAVADIAAKSMHDVTDDENWDNALCGESVRVWSLGYGANAQAIVKNLYIHTTRMIPVRQEQNAQPSENKVRYIPNNFRAQVFSPDADTAGAFLSYENPFVIYLYDKKGEVLPESEKEQTDKIHQIFKAGAERMLNAALKEAETKDWAAGFLQNGKLKADIWHPEELSPMIVDIHKESCVDFDFLKKLDGVTGKDQTTDRPQFIVIATGDDYQNIRLTNALVYDIMRETVTEETPGSKPASKQMIIVNLRDQKNADLFNSKYTGTYSTYLNDGYTKINVNENLVIAIVGVNENLYSKNIIEYKKATNYSYNYDIASSLKTQEEIKTVLEDSKRPSGEKSLGLISQYYANINDATKGNLINIDKKKWRAAIALIKKKITEKYEKPNSPEEILKNWRSMSQWDKESNQSARLFLKVFEKERAKIESDPDEAIRYMLTEHQRWMRLHFVNGWVPGSKKKEKKRHDCLLPFNMVGPFTFIYDFVNTLWDGGKKED